LELGSLITKGEAKFAIGHQWELTTGLLKQREGIMSATTKMKDQHGGGEFTMDICDGEGTLPETIKTTLVQAEKVISKVLADLKRGGEEGRAVLRQML
jgi:hypothetical protein